MIIFPFQYKDEIHWFLSPDISLSFATGINKWEPSCDCGSLFHVFVSIVPTVIWITRIFFFLQIMRPMIRIYNESKMIYFFIKRKYVTIAHLAVQATYNFEMMFVVSFCWIKLNIRFIFIQLISCRIFFILHEECSLKMRKDEFFMHIRLSNVHNVDYVIYLSYFQKKNIHFETATELLFLI